MPKLKPVSWRELVRQLKKFGFEGPYQVGKHPYMIKGDLTLTIPNPHSKDNRRILYERSHQEDFETNL